MPGFSDIVKKAFYLGVGLAASAGEKAGGTLAELREQAQKLADEMVAKGEMTTEEAKRMVDEMIQRAQQQSPSVAANAPSSEPRRIEIISDEEEPSSAKPENVDALRDQVSALQDELRRLQRDR